MRLALPRSAPQHMLFGNTLSPLSYPQWQQDIWPCCSGGFKVQPATSEPLPSVSWDWVSPGRHRCTVAAPPHKLWVLGLPLNCCHHNPGSAVTITQGTADPGTPLNSPTQAILPAHAPAVTPQPHSCVRSGAGCGLLTSLISHFSFFPLWKILQKSSQARSATASPRRPLRPAALCKGGRDLAELPLFRGCFN